MAERDLPFELLDWERAGEVVCEEGFSTLNDGGNGTELIRSTKAEVLESKSTQLKAIESIDYIIIKNTRVAYNLPGREQTIWTTTSLAGSFIFNIIERPAWLHLFSNALPHMNQCILSHTWDKMINKWSVAGISEANDIAKQHLGSRSTPSPDVKSKRYMQLACGVQTVRSQIQAWGLIIASSLWRG